jgi:hypothetical protein
MLKRIFTLAFAVGLVATSSSALFAQEEKTGFRNGPVDVKSRL